MKQKITLVVISLSIGFVVGYMVKPTMSDQLKECQSTINNTRNALIELNKHYNTLFNGLGYYAMQGNSEATLSIQALQELFPRILHTCKTIGLDCNKYDEDGTPTMIENENGNKNPVEILPEEIKQR